MCEAYYLEALEHSAHIVTVLHQQQLCQDIKAREAHIRKLEERREANKKCRDARFITFNQWVDGEPPTK